MKSFNQKLLSLCTLCWMASVQAAEVNFNLESPHNWSFEWGWNNESYSKSDIHFKGIDHQFTLFGVRAPMTHSTRLAPTWILRATWKLTLWKTISQEQFINWGAWIFQMSSPALGKTRLLRKSITKKPVSPWDFGFKSSRALVFGTFLSESICESTCWTAQAVPKTTVLIS